MAHPREHIDKYSEKQSRQQHKLQASQDTTHPLLYHNGVSILYKTQSEGQNIKWNQYGIQVVICNNKNGKLLKTAEHIDRETLSINMNTVCIANGNCDYGPGMQLQELQGHLSQFQGGRVRNLRIRQKQKLQHQATVSEDSYAPRILHVGSLNLCKHLVTLEIIGIGAEVDGLSEIPTLRHLHLSWDDSCTAMSLHDLSQLTNHAHLETLTLANCHRLLNIDALGTYCSRLLQEAKHTDNSYAQEQVWSSYCLIWAVTIK